MKRINTILFAVLGILLMSSCEDFLDKRPTNSGDSASAIQNITDAEFFLNGIITKISSSSYLGRNMLLYADAKGGDLTIISQGRSNDLYLYNHTPSSGSQSGFWTVGYNTILQINNLLQNVDKMIEAGEAGNFNDIKGQALTIRAMIYFDLVRLYGEPYNEDKTAWGVPNVLEPLDAMARELRATVETNYKTIIDDLTAAEVLLSNSKSKNEGFINYWANKALQARVYLSMDDFANALKAAEEIITDSPYRLYSNDEWVASWSKQWGSESIFELAMLGGENALSGTSSLGAYYARAGHFNNNMGSYVASTYFLDRLNEDPTDIRWGVMDYDETSNTRMGCCYKYLGGVADKNGKFAGDGSDKPNYAVNIKVIRLSEIYLIASEAALRKSSPDKATAVKYLNNIRKRAQGLAPATESTISLDMILDEKSKELYGEGHRFWDMIRCNKTMRFDDELGGIYTVHREETVDRTHPKTLLPIFQSEINANPEIEKQQNPGY